MIGHARSRMGWVVAVVLAATCLTATAQSGAKHILVLEGGVLIDGTGAAPLADPVIVVEGDRIKAVGKRGQVAIPSDAQIIRTNGRTILPGLIDSHTHTQDYQMPMFLHYGITTIHDKNNHPAWALTQRDDLKAGKIKGPRMFMSGASIHGPSFGAREAFNLPAINTPEEGRAVALAQAAAGYDGININQSVTEDELAAVIKVGEQTGQPVMGHVRNMRKAAELGHKFEEHMFSMGAAVLDPEDKTKIGLVTLVAPESLADPAKFPPLIKFMVSKGVFLNPTLVTQWSGEAPLGPKLVKEMAPLANDPQLAFVPAEVRAEWSHAPAKEIRGGYPIVAEFVKEYAAAGGKVSVGTDSGRHTIAGLSEHYEMQMLVDAGLTPMQALEAATLWNAQLIHRDKDLGSVEVGKSADFTIIEGDPLKDIANTENIRMVIKDGKVIDTAYDPKWVNPLPEPFSSSTLNTPAIAKISPAIVRQGGGDVTLQVDAPAPSEDRWHFTPQSIVRFDNQDLPTKFVSPTRLTATLDGKLLDRSPGLYALYVVNPGLFGTVSPAAYEVVAGREDQVAAIPVPYNLYGSEANTPRFYGPYPGVAVQGGKGVTLDIKGNKFAPNAVVRFDTMDLPTHFVSAGEVTATLDAGLLNRPAGGYAVYVVNPGLYGTVSEAGYFIVDLKK